MKSKSIAIVETMDVLQEEIIKFRESNATNKFTQMQFENAMARLSEKILNKIYEDYSPKDGDSNSQHPEVNSLQGEGEAQT